MVQKKSSLTVVIPALNEELNIAGTVAGIQPVIEAHFERYELLIFDDASSDRTGTISDDLARKHPNIRVIHNAKTMGLGYNYRKGVELAQMDYIVMIPGDNEITPESLGNIFAVTATADIVIPYTENIEIRPWSRQVLSKTYTALVNTLTGLKVRYYNGCVVHHREIIQKTPLRTDSFAYQAEALVHLLRQGKSYCEVGMVLQPRKGASKAFRIKNVVRVLKSLWTLWRDRCASDCQGKEAMKGEHKK